MTDQNQDPNDFYVDKEYLYGRYQKREDQKADLHLRAAHKALDIPMDDDMHVDNRNSGNTTHNGFGLKEIIGIGLAAAGVGLAWNNPWSATAKVASEVSAVQEAGEQVETRLKASLGKIEDYLKKEKN